MTLKEQIENKFNQIEDVRSHSNPHKLPGLCRELFELINTMQKESQSEEEKNKLQIIGDDLFHTMNKEVQFVYSAYSETLKKNAAKKRQSEYEESLDTAINQLYNDIVLLLR